MKDLAMVHQSLMGAGFEDLRIPVRFKWGDGDDAYAYRIETNAGYNVIFDHEMRNAPFDVVLGLGAHELSHIVIEDSRGPVWNALDDLLLSIPWYEAREERLADAEAVRRGYGAELISFYQWAARRGSQYDSTDGLSEKQIRDLMSFNRS